MRREIYVVGPGPISMRNFLGKHVDRAVGEGCYALARDDERGPRLLDANAWHNRWDAQLNADFANARAD